MKNQKRVPFKQILDDLEEKYSSFDGYDSDEEHSMMNGASHNSYNKLYKPKPFQLRLSNTGKTAKKAVIFGNNKFLISPRFGNPTGVAITVGQPGVDYVEILQQSATQPFYAGLIRIQSENVAQITKIITVHKRHANGREYIDPIDMTTHKSAYQNQDNIVDGMLNVVIDGNTYLETEIEPDTTVIFTIFPADEVDISRTLDGKAPIKNFSSPDVNTGGSNIITHSPATSPRKRLM